MNINRGSILFVCVLFFTLRVHNPACIFGKSKKFANQPAIEFISIPPYGSTQDLSGRVRNVNPDDFKVAVYIFAEGAGWWNKPTFAQPLTLIKSDSTWSADITTGENDINATRIRAFLLSAEINPILSAGLSCLPDSLETLSIASVSTERNSGTLSFSGYTWWRKTSSTQVGPGPNYFSDSKQNVWVDDQGRLHLKITHRDGAWFCPEVILQDTLGYGTYDLLVESDLNELDKNIVFGFFTWDNDACDTHYNEIDIEFSRWKIDDSPNAQYVIQPWHRAGNRYQWSMPSNKKMSNHRMLWAADSLFFKSSVVHVSQAKVDSVVQMWTYKGSDIPTADQTTIRMNFWLVNGIPPSNNSESEIIIADFEHKDLSSHVRTKHNNTVANYCLIDNYPNPFNSSTTIPFYTGQTAHIKIKVFDIRGEQVRLLKDGVFQLGTYKTTWNGRNESNKPVPSGIYLVHLQAGHIQDVQKIALVR
ncbi:T9SS type A sorting domain-containing protein [candidate division KSB1 bacterium]|nr:T9SS type A sorting domain-containing protein [candidate division KSB1 bacterium]